MGKNVELFFLETFDPFLNGVFDPYMLGIVGLEESTWKRVK